MSLCGALRSGLLSYIIFKSHAISMISLMMNRFDVEVFSCECVFEELY